MIKYKRKDTKMENYFLRYIYMDNKYDSSSEYGCYLESIKYNIPDRYYTIDIGFEFLVPIEFPDAYDGRYIITVYTFNKDKSIKEYIISMNEPKYIYGSDKLPDDIKNIVISSIIKNYRSGINAINEECERIVIDPDRSIPDYINL